jgi:hypothetical protein
VAGVFTLPFGIDVGPSLTLATARPYNQYGAINPSGAPVGYAPPRLFVVGDDGKPVGAYSGRGTPLVNASARLTKNLSLKGSQKIALFSEFYNIFNYANFGGAYGTIASAATYNKPIGYLQGAAVASSIPVSFQVQFGARYSF